MAASYMSVSGSGSTLTEFEDANRKRKPFSMTTKRNDQARYPAKTQFQAHTSEISYFLIAPILGWAIKAFSSVSSTVLWFAVVLFACFSVGAPVHAR